MKETLYTIPVNDAFTEDCECPICKMYQDIETDAINFTMGPSYMEDDIRMKTDKTGFCKTHIAKLYGHQNRLGLALMLDTHLRHTIKQFEETKPAKAKAPSLFKKNTENRLAWLKTINSSCYICERVDKTFDRYVATIFHLFRTDSEFMSKLKKSKGLCSEHFVLLYENASAYLGGNEYSDFINIICEIYIDNLKRVESDLEWFTDKFDYRNADAPWKNSKDALPRTIIKTNSVSVE
ncbi:MAG: hypothetical protein E7265_10600 [Lachnospiraceae bacterium]|nr:hypothetical protein [Lachnospiraceae bacterium]